MDSADLQALFNDSIERAVTSALSKALAAKETPFNAMPKKQALEILGMSNETACKQMKAGKLPFFKVGRKVFIEMDKIQALADTEMAKYKTGTRGRPRKTPVQA